MSGANVVLVAAFAFCFGVLVGVLALRVAILRARGSHD